MGKKLYICSMILNDKYLNRYRYALCNEHVVNIDEVTKESRKSSKFTCLGCGHEMVAVLGEVREHHFRHKNNENCSNETYLHNLAKKRIKEIFDSNEHFHVLYAAANSCEHFDSCPFHRCKKEFKWPLDLKEYFDTCEIEKGCGGFRPDILLTHSEHPNRKLFIEINVNHPCSDEKLNSGSRIVEIDVVSEQTIIYPFDEGFEHFHFFNFDFKREITPNITIDRFSLIAIDVKNTDSKQDTINCFDYNEHLPNADFDIIIKKKHEQISLESLGLAQTILHGTSVRHCDYCSNRFQCYISIPVKLKHKKTGKIVDGYRKEYIYKKKDVNKWAQAKDCKFFQQDFRVANDIIRNYGRNNYILWNKKNQ